MRIHLNILLLLTCCWLLQSHDLRAQTAMPGQPTTLQNAPQRDTTNRTNSNQWRDEKVTITFRKASSEILTGPDTSIHSIHRRPYSQPWMRDLGNMGSPAYNLLYSPENGARTGPSLGYHVFDAYRLDADSLSYINTSRPYSSFAYRLGSKTEQQLSVLHTQNISPNWNFAIQYRKPLSPGFYSLERVNQDHGSFSTHYKGIKQHYELFGAFVYNKAQQDENGGITADSFLKDSQYSDRKTVPVSFVNQYYNVNSTYGYRSAVTNVFRDFNILIQHSYTWGRTDTLYNADSTQYHFQLTPRFRIAHRFETGSQKYSFKNYAADSGTYASFFHQSFAIAHTDSVAMQQQWFWLNNQFTLNGFIGKREDQLLFSAGIGNRVDDFSTNFVTGTSQTNILSNYLSGELRKEALAPGQWAYNANTQFFFTGSAAGNFMFNAEVGKDLGKNWGALKAGFRQQLSNAPYNYTIFENQYFKETHDLNKESITQIYASLQSDKLGLSGGFRNYVYNNYIYLQDSLGRVTNGRLQVLQYSSPFNLTQIWLRKIFHFGYAVLDNEIAFQQVAGAAPMSVPTLMGRHQLSYERYIFGNKLKVATGVEARYHTAYFGNGYSAFYNRFYYQTSYELKNKPEFSAFFNFKVKRFRSYFMVDQLQTFFWTENFAAPGYPTQGFMIRFGFDWIMIN